MWVIEPRDVPMLNPREGPKKSGEGPTKFGARPNSKECWRGADLNDVVSRGGHKQNKARGRREGNCGSGSPERNYGVGDTGKKSWRGPPERNCRAG